MYGQTGTASATAGASLAVTGLSVGSQICAAVAIALIVIGTVLLVVNHRRRKGARP